MSHTVVGSGCWVELEGGARVAAREVRQADGRTRLEAGRYAFGTGAAEPVWTPDPEGQALIDGRPLPGVPEPAPGLEEEASTVPLEQPAPPAEG